MKIILLTNPHKNNQLEGIHHFREATAPVKYKRTQRYTDTLYSLIYLTGQPRRRAVIHS